MPPCQSRKRQRDPLDKTVQVFYSALDRRTYVPSVSVGGGSMLSAIVVGLSVMLGGFYLVWQWWSRELAEGE
jgi:hypothetical protein